MRLPVLPLELWRIILIHAVAVRGVKRGVRLRLVCKLFASEVYAAILASDILDTFCCHGSSRTVDQVKKRLHSPYIRRLALNTPLKDDTPAWIRAVNEVADFLLSRTDDVHPYLSREEYVVALCELSRMEDAHSFNGKGERRVNAKHDRDNIAAAASLGFTSVIREIDDDTFEKLCEFRDTGVPFFGSHPFTLAALHNRHDLLRVVLQKARITQWCDAHHLKEQLLLGATAGGHLETVDFLLNDTQTPYRVYRPLNNDYSGKGSWNPKVFDMALKTPSIAVFDRVLEYRQTTLLSGPIPMVVQRYIASTFVDEGWADVLEMLFQKHWDHSDPSPPDRSHFFHFSFGGAIRQACKRGDLCTLQILFKYAPPDGKISTGSTSIAAAGGRLDILKLLVDHGNNIEDLWVEPFMHTLPPAIVSAVVLEHGRMIHYLLAHGANLQDMEIAADAVGRAKYQGLDSMLEFLKAEGVEVEGFPSKSVRTAICGC